MINISILRRQLYSRPGRVLRRCVTPGTVTASQCHGPGAHRAPTLVPGVVGRVSAWLGTCRGWGSPQGPGVAGDVAGLGVPAGSGRGRTLWAVLEVRLYFPCGAAVAATRPAAGVLPGRVPGPRWEPLPEQGAEQHQRQRCRWEPGRASPVGVAVVGPARPLQLLEGDGRLVRRCALQGCLHLRGGTGWAPAVRGSPRAPHGLSHGSMPPRATPCHPKPCTSPCVLFIPWPHKSPCHAVSPHIPEGAGLVQPGEEKAERGL